MLENIIADLIKYNDENHSKYKFKKVFKASTSGSSGESLEYYRDEESDSFSRALIQEVIHGMVFVPRNKLQWIFLGL